MGTVGTEMEGDPAGAKIMEGWWQLVKNTPRPVIRKRLFVCNRAVKRRYEKVKEAMRVTRQAHATCILCNTTVG